MKKKPIPRGREGGRKLKYGEPTKYISFRVPESKEAEVRQAVRKILEGLKLGSK